MMTPQRWCHDTLLLKSMQMCICPHLSVWTARVSITPAASGSY